MKGGEGLLGAAQQGVEVGWQDAAGAGVSQSAVFAGTTCVPAGRKVPAGLCGRFQIEPQLLFSLCGEENGFSEIKKKRCEDSTEQSSISFTAKTKYHLIRTGITEKMETWNPIKSAHSFIDRQANSA